MIRSDQRCNLNPTRTGGGQTGPDLQNFACFGRKTKKIRIWGMKKSLPTPHNPTYTQTFHYIYSKYSHNACGVNERDYETVVKQSRHQRASEMQCWTTLFSIMGYCFLWMASRMMISFALDVHANRIMLPHTDGSSSTKWKCIDLKGYIHWQIGNLNLAINPVWLIKNIPYLDFLYM